MVCFPALLFGQETTFSVKFKLIDDRTNSSIEDSKIQITDLKSGKRLRLRVFSGDTVRLPYSLEGEWRITANTPGYKNLDTTILLNAYKKEVRKNEVAEVSLEFTFDGQYTGEVDINATYKPKVKFQSERISVSDYIIIDEDHLLLLTYPKRLEKGSELIWFVNDQIKGRRRIENRAISLEQDFRDRIYLRCEDRDYSIHPGSSLTLHRVEGDYIDDYVFPILDSLGRNILYFSNYNAYYPAYDYIMVEKTDTTYTTIRHLEDDLMMEQYRSEYKFADVRTKLWAWDMEAETGIDRQIWVGANIFTNSIYYDPPIGDFFRVNQDLFVYDFYNDLLLSYEAYSAKPTDSLAISFHLDPRKTGWEQRIIQDPVTKKMYTYFDEAGYYRLAEVNLETGELINEFKLFYRYAENIQIFDGSVYYIYRPFESPQKKYLYYEELN
jgi:hypothetical protein